MSGRSQGTGLPDGLSPEEAARWEKLARRLLVGSAAVMGGLILLTFLALAMAPRDDSTLGTMKALVFRCH
jgi:hypothetical protein